MTLPNPVLATETALSTAYESAPFFAACDRCREMFLADEIVEVDGIALCPECRKHTPPAMLMLPAPQKREGEKYMHFNDHANAWHEATLRHRNRRWWLEYDGENVKSVFTDNTKAVLKAQWSKRLTPRNTGKPCHTPPVFYLPAPSGEQDMIRKGDMIFNAPACVMFRVDEIVGLTVKATSLSYNKPIQFDLNHALAQIALGNFTVTRKAARPSPADFMSAQAQNAALTKKRNTAIKRGEKVVSIEGGRTVTRDVKVAAGAEYLRPFVAQHEELPL